MWADRLKAISPGGSQTISKSLNSYGLTGQVELAERGDRAHLWTTDGRRFLDWGGSLGANVLGYNHPAVVEAVAAQLRDGGLFSLPHRLEAEVGERFCEIIPCAKRIRFTRTGSESCVGAARIARAFTKRDVILYCGYHGWHGDFVATRPEHPGAPMILEEIADSFRYNDLDDLRDRRRGDMVAAVMMEPTLFEQPSPGFLEGVRDWCDEVGALLIFDEMVLSPRLARAGGQERFGVVPDLSAHGKGWGNGLSFSFICGRADIMEVGARLVSGTFGGETLSLAAAKAVLDVYAKEDVCGHMEEIGLKLWGGIGNLPVIDGLRKHCLDLKMVGWMPVGKLVGLDNRSLGLFTQEMARRGVLWHPRITYVSLAHTEADVKVTVEAAAEAFQAVKWALDTGDWSLLKGQPPEEPFARKGAA